MMCHDVLLAHECLVVVAFILGFTFSGSHSYLWFAFAIHDMIGCGMMWGDIMMNSFTFSCESHWHMTKSVALLESL